LARRGVDGERGVVPCYGKGGDIQVGKHEVEVLSKGSDRRRVHKTAVPGVD